MTPAPSTPYSRLCYQNLRESHKCRRMRQPKCMKCRRIHMHAAGGEGVGSHGPAHPSSMPSWEIQAQLPAQIPRVSFGPARFVSMRLSGLAGAPCSASYHITPPANKVQTNSQWCIRQCVWWRRRRADPLVGKRCSTAHLSHFQWNTSSVCGDMSATSDTASKSQPLAITLREDNSFSSKGCPAGPLFPSPYSFLTGNKPDDVVARRC